MPLDRAHVTAASRIMLPAYVGFFAIIGLNYTFGTHDRLVAAPALRYADGIMSLRAWGLVFLAASVLMMVALWSGRRLLFQYALLVCAISEAVWTAVSVFAAFSSQATVGGWAYPAFVVAACIASYRSLGKREAD